MIGQHMRVDDALDAVQFHGSIPVFEFLGNVYCLDYTGRVRGQVYYTKFEMDMRTPIHSVHMPYSNTHTLGEVIRRGEGLREKLDPDIDELPENAFRIIQPQGYAPIITRYI